MRPRRRIAPDHIYNLDPRTGWAMKAKDPGGYDLGSEVFMMGRAAAKGWRTPEGIDLVDPHRFGFDPTYRPIEELFETRPVFEG